MSPKKPERKPGGGNDLNAVVGRYLCDRAFAGALHKDPRGVLAAEGYAVDEGLISYLERAGELQVTRDILGQMSTPTGPGPSVKTV